MNTQIYLLKQTPGKGEGVFAARDIRRGDYIFHVDLNVFEKYSPEALELAVAADPKLNGDHANYVGHGKYVIEETPAAYMNHSCEPNCAFKMKSIAVYDVIARRDISEGEELTHDYTACSVDQFAGQGFWLLACQCGSENCRKQVTGDFFEMPEAWQRQYYPYLPPSTRRKYKDRFRFLKETARA